MLILILPILTNLLFAFIIMYSHLNVYNIQYPYFCISSAISMTSFDDPGGQSQSQFIMEPGKYIPQHTMTQLTMPP